MFKFAVAFVLATLSIGSVHATIPIGGLCAGFAGPSSIPCVSGSICCSVGPDRSLCAAVKSCPSQFLPVGATCSGIAGPSPFPCFPGTACCNISPDLSRCQVTC